MLYLLGELPSDVLADFERQLACSPKLGEELLRQAETIADVSSQQTFPTTSPLIPAANDESKRWTFVASLVAIAACLTLVFVGLRRSEPDPQRIASLTGIDDQPRADAMEDLLIARAWAESPLTFDADDYELDESDPAVATVPSDDPADNDATLSWIITALASESETDIPGASEDG